MSVVVNDRCDAVAAASKRSMLDADHADPVAAAVATTAARTVAMTRTRQRQEVQVAVAHRFSLVVGVPLKADRFKREHRETDASPTVDGAALSD